MRPTTRSTPTTIELTTTTTIATTSRRRRDGVADDVEPVGPRAVACRQQRRSPTAAGRRDHRHRGGRPARQRVPRRGARSSSSTTAATSSDDSGERSTIVIADLDEHGIGRAAARARSRRGHRPSHPCAAHLGAPRRGPPPPGVGGHRPRPSCCWPWPSIAVFASTIFDVREVDGAGCRVHRPGPARRA